MSAFRDAIEHNLAGLENISVGLVSTCDACQSTYGYDNYAEFADAIDSQDALDEGSFSKQPCDSCGSRLGGSRFAAHAFMQSGDMMHLKVCTDCLMFIANGDEPEQWPAT